MLQLNVHSTDDLPCASDKMACYLAVRDCLFKQIFLLNERGVGPAYTAFYSDIPWRRSLAKGVSSDQPSFIMKPIEMRHGCHICCHICNQERLQRLFKGVEYVASQVVACAEEERVERSSLLREQQICQETESCIGQ